MRQGKGVSVVLVLGGVRSGKSRFAQRVADVPGRVTFIATAQAVDEEMRRKISRHRGERPAHWRTVEEPLRLGAVLREAAQRSDRVLVDCLTLFTTSLLDAYAEDESGLEAEIDALCEALRGAACTIVLVSNEVGSGVVPAFASGRRFRDLAGEINQRVAAIADCVVMMVAGLPLALKGMPPEVSQ